MATTSINSPEPLSKDVIPLAPDILDTRSYEEIVADLRKFRPVQRERNVWAFWDKGFDGLHPWCQRNIVGWVRRLGVRWDVRCVDMVPGSPNNINNFASKDHIPECLVQGTMDGPFAGIHASDLARLALLYEHGGMWTDNASMIFCDLDQAFWNSFEDPNSPYEVLAFHLPAKHFRGGLLTSCLASRKGNILIEKWMTVLNEMWKGRTNAMGLHDHPLIQHLDPFSPITHIDVGLAPVDGKLDPTFVGTYFGINFAYERVRLLNDKSDGWNGLDYLRDHVLLVEAVDELWKSYMIVPAEKHYDLLSQPFDPSNEVDESQVQVRSWVQHLTSSCFAVKFSSSYWQPGMPVPLPKKWQEAGNEKADIAPGTWAEYLRFASEHFTQQRFQQAPLKSVEYIPGEFGTVFEGKLLEPIKV